MNEEDFPALYQDADASAKKAQSRFYWFLRIYLISLILASFMSVANCTSNWFAAIQVLALITSLALATFLAKLHPQKVWYAMRALAESVKTISWRYMMQAEPFNVDENTAKKAFQQSVNKILDANQSIVSHVVSFSTGQQLTTRMREIRRLDLDSRRKFYEKHRIADQGQWYLTKAEENKKLSTRWTFFLVLSNALAIVSAVARILSPDVSFWPVDIFVATAAAIMAWIQTKRFEELSASYTLTSYEIRTLCDSLPENLSEEEFSDFVGDAENAFSREHTQWQARRDS